MTERFTVPCGAEYPEADSSMQAASLPMCACNTFAIGTCSRCGNPVCGIHSRVIKGQRVCGSCSAREVVDLRRTVEEAEAARTTAILSIEHPVERFLVAILAHLGPGPWATAGATASILDGSELRNRLSKFDFDNVVEDTRKVWRIVPSSVAPWVADRLTRIGVEPDSSVETAERIYHLFGGAKERVTGTFAAWRFPQAIAIPRSIETPSGDGYVMETVDGYVTVGGHITSRLGQLDVGIITIGGAAQIGARVGLSWPDHTAYAEAWRARVDWSPAQQ